MKCAFSLFCYDSHAVSCMYASVSCMTKKSFGPYLITERILYASVSYKPNHNHAIFGHGLQMLANKLPENE